MGGTFWRILRGVTPAADVTLGCLMPVFFVVGGLLHERTLRLLVPSGAALVMVSPTELSTHRTVAMAVLAMIPALAWIVAALRGFRSGVPSGVVRCCAYTAGITSLTALAFVSRVRLWRSAFSDSPTGIQPLVRVSDLDHFWFGLEVALVGTLAMSVWILFRPRPSRFKGKFRRT